MDDLGWLRETNTSRHIRRMPDVPVEENNSYLGSQLPTEVGNFFLWIIWSSLPSVFFLSLAQLSITAICNQVPNPSQSVGECTLVIGWKDTGWWSIYSPKAQRGTFPVLWMCRWGGGQGIKEDFLKEVASELVLTGWPIFQKEGMNGVSHLL